MGSREADSEPEISLERDHWIVLLISPVEGKGVKQVDEREQLSCDAAPKKPQTTSCEDPKLAIRLGLFQVKVSRPSLYIHKLTSYWVQDGWGRGVALGLAALFCEDTSSRGLRSNC